jgi:hypothetical protein
MPQHPKELVLGLGEPITIVCVGHEYDGVRILVVMVPQGPDLAASRDVPDSEGSRKGLDGLNIEADGGNGGNDLSKLELVQNGGLACGVKTSLSNNTSQFCSIYAVH